MQEGAGDVNAASRSLAGRAAETQSSLTEGWVQNVMQHRYERRL